MKLSGLIGLEKEKRKARLLIRSCLNSGESFPHTLLFAIGGLGKTAFGRSIGDELDCHFVETHAAAFKKRKLLFSALLEHSKAAERQGKPLFLFIDEIHRLKLPLQEALYQAMKEWWIPTAQGKLYISPFTLMGATTRFDMLDANSFVTRFENVWEISRYKLNDMAIIVANELSKYDLKFSSEVAYNIAQRCLGIPRTAINLATKVRRTCISSGRREVTLSDCELTFELEGIDSVGLHDVHRRYLRILSKSTTSNGDNCALGVGAISAKMRQPEDMIKGSVEPILFELNMVSPTPRGRILTDTGHKYLLGSE